MRAAKAVVRLFMTGLCVCGCLCTHGHSSIVTVTRQILSQASSGIDVSTAAPKLAAKYMANSIAEYNKRTTHRAWKIQGRTHTTLMALCQTTPKVISMLESHYSTVRHSEGALTLDQLGYCDWALGSSRIPDGIADVPTMWKMMMDVTPASMEEFACNLASSLWCGTVLGSLVSVHAAAHSRTLLPRGASVHPGLQPQDRAFVRRQKGQARSPDVEASCHGLAGRLLRVRVRAGPGPEAVRQTGDGPNRRPVAKRVARLRSRTFAMLNCLT